MLAIVMMGIRKAQSSVRFELRIKRQILTLDESKL